MRDYDRQNPDGSIVSAGDSSSDPNANPHPFELPEYPIVLDA